LKLTRDLMQHREHQSGDPQRFAAALLKRTGRILRAKLVAGSDPQRFAAALLKRHFGMDFILTTQHVIRSDSLRPY